MGRKQKDWIERILDDINQKSKLFNPKELLKGNRIEEERFMNDCKYQYIQKHDDARQLYKHKKKLGTDAILDSNPRTKSSAVHLLLYKQMLQ